MSRIFLAMNGKRINTLEDLRNNFNPEQMLSFYRSGRLQKWLEECGLNDELENIGSFEANYDDSTLLSMLMAVFELDDTQILNAQASVKEEKHHSSCLLRQDIFNKIRVILSRNFNINIETILMSSKFDTDLGMTDCDQIQILKVVSRELHDELSDKQLNAANILNICNVDSLVDLFLTRNVSKKIRQILDADFNIQIRNMRAQFIRDFGMDERDIQNLCHQIEKTFDVKLDRKELDCIADLIYQVGSQIL